MNKTVAAVLIMAVLFIYGCAQPPEAEQQPIEPEAAQEGNSQQTIENTTEAQEETQETITEKIHEPEKTTTEEIQKQEEVKTPEKPEEEAFQIFNASLTYPNAYNGPLYGTSEQVGGTGMDSYFELLDENGINYFIGMFAIFGEQGAGILTSDQNLGNVIQAAQRHPKRIIPFFNPGIGGEEIEEEGLLKTSLFGWYSDALVSSKAIAGDNFIMGLGEVETQEWSARHNGPKIMELVSLAQSNNINFMFHPVANKISDVEKMIEAYPNTVFLIHMYREDLDKSMPQLIKIMKEHDNLYYSIDAAHIMHIDGDVIYEFDSTNRQSSIQKFVSYYDSKEKTFVKNAIDDYKPLVEAVPDKVMWGTEIGPAYAFDPEVFNRAVKASRMVIAGFAPEHQEGVAYKNALRVFGEGVVADKSIKVIDTSSWPYCTGSQISKCDGGCIFDEEESPEANRCLLRCTIPLGCVEKFEMDVG